MNQRTHEVVKMSNSDLIQEVEVSIEDCKRIVEIRNSLNRLIKNKDFRKVIEDGYLRDEAVRLVTAKASPALQSEDMQRKILRDIDAIGSFNQYLSTIMQTGYQAEKALEDAQETLQELLKEAQE